MNSNSYLGMGLRAEVVRAEEEATAEFGAGPGAVRFISGTYRAHVDLERIEGLITRSGEAAVVVS